MPEEGAEPAEVQRLLKLPVSHSTDAASGSGASSGSRAAARDVTPEQRGGLRSLFDRRGPAGGNGYPRRASVPSKRQAFSSPASALSSGGTAALPSDVRSRDDSPVAGKIRCLSVSSFLSNGRGLLKWKGDGANPDERSLRDFFEAMVGPRGLDPQSLNSEATCGCGLCLEELSAETARELVQHSVVFAAEAAASSWSPGQRGTCLARALQPYLEDLLTRRQGFRSAVDLLAGAADADERLPKVLTEITAKDLLIALLLVAPRRRRARLALAYAGLASPLPLVFRVAAGPGGGGELRTVAGFDVLHELTCVPCTGRQLLVNLGTERVAGSGKTSLMSALALTTMAEEDLDVRPSGPMHTPSCDLLCAGSDRWIVDVHGHWNAADEAFRMAVVALALWGGATCLVHCNLADFHPKTGVPKKELASLLSTVCQTAVRPGADGAGTTARVSGAVLLLRDTPAEALVPRQAALDKALQPFNVLEVIAVEDCRGFRTPVRRAGACDRLRSRVEAALQKAATRGAATPSLEELHRVHQALSEGTAIFGIQATSTSVGSAPPRHSSLGEELFKHLDRALAGGAVASTLFPLSAVDRRLAALRRVEASEARGEGGMGGPQLEQMRLAEDRAKKREAEISKLENELANTPCSDAMLFFRRVVSSKDHLPAVAELGLYLEAWKEPRVQPLLERQREMLDKAEQQKELQGGSPPDAEAGEGAKELEKVADELSELDFSMDSFWTELELLAQRHERAAAEQGQPREEDLARAKECLQSLLAGGHPFQVLHSRPLQMAGRFLREILGSIGVTNQDPRGIYVVSVLGAQSSAKSTLLNFLFGCGFAVRAGRCTRGLYASYFRPATGGPPMLVLDSEGLLSLGSEGGVFDGQIALMCMTCSHLVLVNNKGELSRQLQDLLEVCLFAMRHLRLARLQPRLVFVLRDQHDRSRTVHEDMLKKMRSHLEDVARTLGTPLHDLILLDGTAVSLLPSAVTSELRQGREVCWTSELFAREVLQLRGEVFRWLREDTERRQGGSPPEFSSLAHWYDYASTVWETLDQFGEQLLHYKTLHEIELRRELADVAKAAVRDALDGAAGSDSDGTGGFHARARQMVDSHVLRMHAAPTRIDLETMDMELSRSLACLRDECVTHLEELFQERTSSPRYSATAKEQAKQQIRTPIEWAYENHLYTWKLHLKKASDERAMHELWKHFTGVLNVHLAGSGHRSCLSEAESHQLFEKEWLSYEASFLDRLQRLTKDWHTVAHEVTMLFNHAVGKLQHEAGALALLKEVGPQQLASQPEAQRETSCLTKQTDEEWEDQYFYVGWWGTVKARGLALLQNVQLSGSGAAEEASGASTLRSTVIPRMRQVAGQGLQQFRTEVRSRGMLDEVTVAEGLRHITGSLLQEMETRSLAGCSVTLKRPQLLHALHVALRLACVEALMGVEADKQKKAMADLLAQKALVEEHFLLIVQANKGDVERATNFATLYHRSLMNWLDHEVTQLAADVRSQVLNEMPDPQKSSERAFQLSFVARSWHDVLEYVLDMNAYLEKIYLTVFHQRKRAFVGPARARVEKRVTRAYHLLQEAVSQWGRSEQATSQQDRVDVVTGRAVAPQLSIRMLKDFISTHQEQVPASEDSAEAHRQLAERLPETADFKIADPKLFASTLQARIGDFVESPEIHQRLNEKVDKALREQSVRAWSLIRGCSERCPLCGSKCDLVGEHTRHHCAHHLFPAFHGWMDRNTGLPSFNHCLGFCTREGTYECKDGVWRKLEDYLRSDHPAWLPFARDTGAQVEQDIQHLQAAWVHCREPLLEYFAPMADDCPEDWVEEHLMKGRALTKKDLESAKDTIRRLRNHTWVPPDD